MRVCLDYTGEGPQGIGLHCDLKLPEIDGSWGLHKAGSKHRYELLTIPGVVDVFTSDTYALHIRKGVAFSWEEIIPSVIAWLETEVCRGQQTAVLCDPPNSRPNSTSLNGEPLSGSDVRPGYQFSE